jgi:hypothetical protein
VRALHAALGRQRAFASFADELQRTQGTTLTLRLGVHSGPVMVTVPGDEGRLDYAAQGSAVHLAHRLRELARDGTIYVSEAGWRQATGFFRFNELGEFTLPEVAQPVRIYVCTGIDHVGLRLEAVLRRHLSVFLGRGREMELLNTLWARVRHGQGQVVCLVGEPGATWGPGLALMYSEFGRQSEAREEFQRLACHHFADIPRDSLWVTCLVYQMEVCAFLHDAERAAILYHLLQPYSGRNVVVGGAVACYGAVDRYLAPREVFGQVVYSWVCNHPYV